MIIIVVITIIINTIVITIIVIINIDTITCRSSSSSSSIIVIITISSDIKSISIAASRRPSGLVGTIFPFSREQQDVHGYERKVQEMSKLLPSPPPQEAEAVEVASVTHQGPELKQRVETIVVRERYVLCVKMRRENTFVGTMRLAHSNAGVSCGNP